jgi:hypothetical protein
LRLQPPHSHAAHVHIVCTVYSRIEAQASISLMALEIRLQNETGVYLCSTVLAPGRMSARSAARLFMAGLCHFYSL